MRTTTQQWWRTSQMLFAVGIEDTFIPQTSRGERALDEYELTQHYDHWEADIDLVAESGATMVRWGVPWYRVNPEPDVWDWDWLDKVADKFDAVGVTPIVDLMHYGTPTWLTGEFFHPNYPEAVAEYARQVAARYRGRWSIYTPMNEPMLNALYCGLYGYWPPYGVGDEGFVKIARALARGIVATQAAIRSELDDASFVHVEASFRFVAAEAGDEPRAEYLRERSFLLQDLVTGRVDSKHLLAGLLRDNGFTEADFSWHLRNTALPDVMGVNYYPGGQTELVSAQEPHSGGPGDFRPRINAWTEGLEDVLRAFASRYGVPVFLTETSTVGNDDERAAWLDASVDLVHSLRRRGLDVVGYTWWSIIDMVEWTYREGEFEPLHYQLGMGLWALEEDDQGVLRRVRTPLADRFKDHALRSRPICLYRGGLGETGPLYTRLLATSPDGPNAGKLLLTAEVYRDVDGSGPAFPIWAASIPETWERIGEVRDTQFGFGNRYQPVLFELPRPIGEFPSGTILLAGSAIPPDLSETHLVLYASRDGGVTWTFVSEIDAGGPAVYDPSPTSTTSAIWEPNLYVVGDKLVCMYADEREKDRSMLQTLVHRTTKDLRSWSEPVLDFGVPDSSTRPGMFVSTGQLPGGRYAAVFEVVGLPDAPIFFTESVDGVDWGHPADLGRKLMAAEGTILSGSPNIVWRTGAGDNTELLVTGRVAIETDGSTSEVALMNVDGGKGDWTPVPLPVQGFRLRNGDNSGYSQSLVWMADGSLVQATTVRNDSGSHDIVVGRSHPFNQ